MLLVLRLTGGARDNVAIPVDKDHPRAGADGQRAAISRKRQPRVKMRMGESACEDVKEKDEHAKGYGGLTLSRAPCAAFKSVTRF